MKKLISIISAVLFIFSAVISAAASEPLTVICADNTFDNFTPGPGIKAPGNWYDPYCYNSDGRINKYCLNQCNGVNAFYCPEYHRIFTVTSMGRMSVNKRNRSYVPYEVFCENRNVWSYYYETVKVSDVTMWYCPYCGKYELADYTNESEYKSESAVFSHEAVNAVVYGYHCDKCDSFVADCNFAGNRPDNSPFTFITNYSKAFGDCHDETDINSVKLYRFLDEAQRTSDYSFIFTETETDFGDGRDGRVEDLEKDDCGNYCSWNSPDNPYCKPLTLLQKIAKFFSDFFRRISELFH